MKTASHSIPRMALSILIGLSVSGLSACASLEEEIDHFQVAASSPFRDINLLQQPIPDQLQYLSHPYGQAGMSGCQAWSAEIQQLEQAYIANDGRRPGYRRDSITFVGRTGNLRDAGVRALSRSVLPFRGVVRQVSGAARLEQNAGRASDRARYRIGYLVGLARANNCPGFTEGRQTLVQHRPVQPTQTRQSWAQPHALSPAVVRQSYPTLSPSGRQVVRTAPSVMRAPPYVAGYYSGSYPGPYGRVAPTQPTAPATRLYPPSYYPTYPQGYTQPSPPPLRATPPATYQHPQSGRVSRGPQRSSRR